VLLQQRDEAFEALHYLMQQFDGEVWNCEQCGHVEDTATTDSAIWLRDWLKTHNAKITGG
jgi:recombinational DNA repair protein RecR